MYEPPLTLQSLPEPLNLYPLLKKSIGSPVVVISASAALGYNFALLTLFGHLALSNIVHGPPASILLLITKAGLNPV